MNNRRIHKQVIEEKEVVYTLARTCSGYVLGIKTSEHEVFDTKPLPIRFAFANRIFRMLRTGKVTPVTAKDVICDMFLELLC